MGKKSHLLTFIVVISAVFIISGIIIALLVFSLAQNSIEPVNSGSSDTNEQTQSPDNSVIETPFKADFKLKKISEVEYQLLVLNDSIEPETIQFLFAVENQIAQFKPSTDYDVVLQNQLGLDGSLRIALGRLNNFDKTSKEIDLETGAFIIGKIILKEGSKSGRFILVTDDLSSFIYNETQGSVGFEQFQASLP